MKRNLLDITQKLSRKVVTAKLDPENLSDQTYWIWVAKKCRFPVILPEIQIPQNYDNLFVTVNTQYISPRDYIVEEAVGNIYIKFIKNKFQYVLDEEDYIEIKGNFEIYA